MAIDPCYRRLHIAFNHTSSLISKIQIIILQNKKNVLLGAFIGKGYIATHVINQLQACSDVPLKLIFPIHSLCLNYSERFKRCILMK